MLVSHETPISLFHESLKYNDYDYCLVHLLLQSQAYLAFFKNSIRSGRRVLLDNSMFELGESFDADEFAAWVETLKPYEYIVPDVYQDAEKTIDNFEKWIEKHNSLPGLKIGTVQGKTYEEIVECYKYMQQKADKIAMSFDNDFLMSTGIPIILNPTRWHILMDARQRLIVRLDQDGIWDYSKPHHLLGCALPQEFLYYNKSVPNIGKTIETIDTSNPIVAGLHSIKYKSYGLDDKNTTLLADLINAEITPEDWDIISYNIKAFKKINYIKGKNE